MKRYEGELIFEGHDAFGTVEVVDAPPLRTLHLGTPTIQSSMYLDDPYALEMEYLRKMALALVFKPTPRRALFLGMGGGCLPKFIWKYIPECHVDAVDISPLVIEVCRRFFQLPEDMRLQVYESDALHFLQGVVSNDHRYDILFVDLFSSQGMAPVLDDTQFFDACHQVLNDNGILVWNVWRSAAKDQLQRLFDRFQQVFGPHFVFLLNKESANYILMIFKGEAQYTVEGIREQAMLLKEHTELDAPMLAADIQFFRGSKIFMR